MDFNSDQMCYSEDIIDFSPPRPCARDFDEEIFGAYKPTLAEIDDFEQIEIKSSDVESLKI